MKAIFNDAQASIKTNLIFKVLIFFFVLVILGCGGPKPENKETILPSLVIIGEDLSQTFKNFTPLTTEDLKLVCKVLSKSAMGGKIVFIGIGTSNPRGYTSCIIKPLTPVDKTGTISKQREQKRENEEAQKKNTESIDEFLMEADDILERRNQPYTDINGFFEKVRDLINAPGFGDYNTWVYINSDGKQSTQTSNKVNCSLLPTVDHLCTSGWKNQPDCKATDKFLGPPDFIQYLKAEILRK